ncbi:hypothetical protein HYT01_03775 [Candidatus Giovannonibacteria bacterium]|nr:hypothetical protein [Candidatus Giovannonibacteria bacterium]
MWRNIYWFVVMWMLILGVAAATPAHANPDATETVPYFQRMEDGVHAWVKLVFSDASVAFVDLGPACPQTKTQAAEMLWGNPDKWQEPTWGFGAWVYLDKGNPVQLNHPGFGVLDYWDRDSRSQTFAGPVGVLVDEASFDCHSDVPKGAPPLSSQPVPPAQAIGQAAQVDNSDPRCPNGAPGAAVLLSEGKGTWRELPTSPERDYRKWELVSAEGDGITLKWPGWGSFDHFSKGEAFKGDVPFAKEATFNCTRN